MKQSISSLARTLAGFVLGAALLLTFTTPLAKGQQSQGQPPQNQASYGFTNWGINGQRVASQFAYTLDTKNGVGTGLGLFTFPATACQNLLKLPGRPSGIDPIALNAQIKIVDINSAATETVAGVTPVISGGLCTLSLAAVNTHTQGSYALTSASCGLREALNDLAGNGGTVFITQEFYQLGCTAATITGLTNSAASTYQGGGLQANQYIVDISQGQNTPFILKGTSLSLTAAPTALTTASTFTTATTGGSISNGLTIRGGITCVDSIGRETPLSTDTAGTAVATTGAGSTNILTVVAPGAAGCPNSVGYRTYLTASGGGTLTEILYAPSSAAATGNQCTASATSVIVSACALTSNSVIVSIITGTAGIPKTGVVSGGSGATAVGYLPARAYPPVPGFQTVYGPFPAITTVTTVQPAAEVVIPANYFNTLGQATQICLGGVGTPAAATVAGTFNLTLGPRQATGVQTIDSVPFTASSTWNPAAASNWTYCTIFVTAATGASGTIEAHTLTGFSTSATAGAVPPAFGPQLDNTTAPSTALDLTQQTYLDVLLTASASSFTTFTVRQISFSALN